MDQCRENYIFQRSNINFLCNMEFYVGNERTLKKKPVGEFISSSRRLKKMFHMERKLLIVYILPFFFFRFFLLCWMVMNVLVCIALKVGVMKLRCMFHLNSEDTRLGKLWNNDFYDFFLCVVKSNVYSEKWQLYTLTQFA